MGKIWNGDAGANAAAEAAGGVGSVLMFLRDLVPMMCVAARDLVMVMRAGFTG